MTNPRVLVEAWVSILGTVPGLAGLTITAFVDRFPELNLRASILQMDPGTMLVVWQGTRATKVYGTWQFRHAFSFFVRAAEAADGGVGYADLFSAFVDGVPGAGPLALLHTEIDASCMPMDLELPSAQRNSLVVSADGATIDYYEFQASLTEKGA